MSTESPADAQQAPHGSAEPVSARLQEKEPESEPLFCGMTRRTLCAGIGGLAAMLALGAVKFVPASAVVRPPGGQDEDALLAACTHCGRCVEACPRHVIKLSHIEDGLLIARTPQMDFERNYCDFCAQEHNGIPKCASACSTGALGSAAKAVDTQTVKLGRAELVQDWCLAYHDTGCRTCYDACPYEAMGLDEQGRPYVIADRCNGCGACESVCVSLTNGSLSLSKSGESRATSRATTVKPLQA